MLAAIKALLRHEKAQLGALLRAYAAVLFVEHPLAGLLFLAATFCFPNIGVSGALAAVVGFITAYSLRFPNLSSGLHIFNSLLVGLSLGAVYQFDAYLALLICLSAVLAVLVTAALSNLLWRLGSLPALSLPFVLVAVTAALAAQAYGNLGLYLQPYAPHATWFGERADDFFASLGAVYFTAHPVAGLLLFVGVLWRSPYLAWLCVSGYAVGSAVYVMLAGPGSAGIMDCCQFNFALSAMALGGIFCVPGKAAFALAMLGAALAALLTAAFQNLFVVYHLPVMAIPFLLTTVTTLYALKLRTGARPPWLALHNPDLPEATYERSRLALARTGDPDSIPLVAPFFGRWQVYQGFSGAHTHKPPWQHALDFIMTENGRSFHGAGKQLSDYHCFALPLRSPAYGYIARIRDHVPDNPPGDVNISQNWGNFVVIRLASGTHVMLAHLQQGSIKVKEGDYVAPGVPLASCGNSGRSAQPHLHLQVQTGAALGSPTCPFHFSGVLVSQDAAAHTGRYYAARRPQQGDWVWPAEREPGLANRLHLPVGRILSFTFTHNDVIETRSLRVELTLGGELRLHSDGGGHCAIQETPSVLGAYDRAGAVDPLLDMWMLAMGLTPLSTAATHWTDAPSARLLPLNAASRARLALRHPLGIGLNSEYRRDWDGAQGCWRQLGEHRLNSTLLHCEASTEAILTPELGCTSLTLRCRGLSWHAQLTEVGLIEDMGIPRWSERVEGQS
jgi:urea transporter